MKTKFKRILTCKRCKKTSYWEIDIEPLNAKWERYYHKEHKGCNCAMFSDEGYDYGKIKENK